MDFYIFISPVFSSTVGSNDWASRVNFLVFKLSPCSKCNLFLYFIHLPMKMEPIVSSETSAIRTQTPGNYPKRNKLHTVNLLHPLERRCQEGIKCRLLLSRRVKWEQDRQWTYNLTLLRPCNVKAKIITYSERLSVALGIQHIPRMCRIKFTSVACLAVLYLPIFSHKLKDFSERN